MILDILAQLLIIVFFLGFFAHLGWMVGKKIVGFFVKAYKDFKKGYTRPDFKTDSLDEFNAPSKAVEKLSDPLKQTYGWEWPEEYRKKNG